MRRRRLALELVSVVVASLSVFAPDDAAAQVTAAPCEADPLFCLAGPIAFSKTKEALPVSDGFDTGWIPPGSPLQVHLAAGLWAETTVSLEGALQSSWPEVLEQRAIGTPGGGALAVHYGAEITAEAQFQVTVLGQTFTWQGDIPYVPQFDFQVEQEQPFDPWAFDGFTVSGVTDQQTLAQVDLADIIGIPAVSGGFELDVALELDARYETSSIVVAETDGTTVAGGAIDAEGGATRADDVGGPAVEHDVHVEGALTYDGTLHLIPAFYLEILGQQFSIPIADYPLPFSIEDKDWVFDPVRVHTPLPDIDLPLYAESDVVSFGDVSVGDRREATIAFDNVGEHLLSVQLVLPDGTPVELPDEPVAVAPDGTAEVVIAYEPTDDAPLDAILVLASNDPDEPARTLSLVGNGVVVPGGEGGGAPGGEGGAGGAASGAGGGALDDAEGGGDASSVVASGGGCSCRASEGSPVGAAGSIALVVAAAVARRRRRPRGGSPDDGPLSRGGAR
jgi:MYXO-CTERM domain-containing protein